MYVYFVPFVTFVSVQLLPFTFFATAVHVFYPATWRYTLYVLASAA